MNLMAYLITGFCILTILVLGFTLGLYGVGIITEQALDRIGFITIMSFCGLSFTTIFIIISICIFKEFVEDFNRKDVE